MQEKNWNKKLLQNFNVITYSQKIDLGETANKKEQKEQISQRRGQENFNIFWG